MTDRTKHAAALTTRDDLRRRERGRMWRRMPMSRSDRLAVYESGVAAVLDRIERGNLTTPDAIAAELWRVVSKVRDIERAVIVGDGPHPETVRRVRELWAGARLRRTDAARKAVAS